LIGFIALCSAVAAFSTGTVHVLTSDNFDAAASSGDWMLEFYAPWCKHCQALAPEWEEAASKSDSVLFGKVDCTEHKSVCDRFNVRGYPTIVFSREGQAVPYEGSRQADAFVEFGERMQEPPVVMVSASETKSALNLERNRVAFVFFGSTSSAEYVLYDHVARVLQPSMIPMYAVSVDALHSIRSWGLSGAASLPLIAVFRVDETGHPDVLEMSSLSAESGEAVLKSWIEENKMQLVPELDGTSYSWLRKSGRTALLLLTKATAQPRAKDMLLQLAQKKKSSKTAQKNNIAYMTMDASKFSDWVTKTLGVSMDTLPRFIGLDAAGEVLYEAPESALTSEAALGAFEESLADGKLPAVPMSKTGGKSYPERLLHSLGMFVIDHTYMALFIGVLMVLALVALVSLCLGGSSDSSSYIVPADKVNAAGSATAGSSAAPRPEKVAERKQD
jgi:protein disulfide-isomerase A1